MTISVDWRIGVTEPERDLVRDDYRNGLHTKDVEVTAEDADRVKVVATVDGKDADDCLGKVIRSTPAAFFRIGPPALPGDIKFVSCEAVQPADGAP